MITLTCSSLIFTPKFGKHKVKVIHYSIQKKKALPRSNESTAFICLISFRWLLCYDMCVGWWWFCSFPYSLHFSRVKWWDKTMIRIKFFLHIFPCRGIKKNYAFLFNKKEWKKIHFFISWNNQRIRKKISLFSFVDAFSFILNDMTRILM